MTNVDGTNQESGTLICHSVPESAQLRPTYAKAAHADIANVCDPSNVALTAYAYQEALPLLLAYRADPGIFVPQPSFKTNSKGNGNLKAC